MRRLRRRGSRGRRGRGCRSWRSSRSRSGFFSGENGKGIKERIHFKRDLIGQQGRIKRGCVSRSRSRGRRERGRERGRGRRSHRLRDRRLCFGSQKVSKRISSNSRSGRGRGGGRGRKRDERLATAIVTRGTETTRHGLRRLGKTASLGKTTPSLRKTTPSLGKTRLRETSSLRIASLTLRKPCLSPLRKTSVGSRWSGRGRDREEIMRKLVRHISS